MRYIVNLLVMFSALLVLCGPVSAHNELMAGSKWFFGKDNVTAVIELAPSLLAKIKGITDGHYAIETSSDQELQQVVAKVIQPYLSQKLALSINNKPYPVKVLRINRKNDLQWEIWLAAQGVSFNQRDNSIKIDYGLFFDETDDVHFNLAFMYSFDAAAHPVPERMDDAAFLERTTFDANNHVWETSIHSSTAEHATPAGSVWATVLQFILLGVKHILTGYDHIAFLLALIVVGLSWREVLKIITAFTIAHSVTLLLSALQVVTLNSRFVEIMIALSICYIAVENLLKKDIKYRWLITFGFGLIHGFGFASTLQELISERSELLPSVVSFNLGVELGQLMIFFLMIPILHLLSKRFEFRKVTAVTSLAVFAVGFTWLLERVFDFKVLPV